jgi:hypothetical protein
MEKTQIDLAAIDHITIAACPGNLLVRGGGAAVSVQGDPFEMTETDDELAISGEGNLQLNVPAHVALTIPHVAGNLLLKRVQGSVSAQQVDGDATLSHISQVKLNRIEGNLVAKWLDETISVEHVAGDAVIRNAQQVNIGGVAGDCVVRHSEGPIHIGDVAGDLVVRRVEGPVDVGKVERDVSLRDVAGDAQVGRVAGDVRLRGELGGDSYTFRADGDIVLNWPADLPLQLTAQAAAIRNRLPLEEVTETEEMLQGRIGKGGAAVSLTANGRIDLKAATGAADAAWGPGMEFGFDMGDMEAELTGISQRIAEEVQAQVSQITADLEVRFGDQFAHKMERVARKAEKAAEKARRRMERQARRGRRHVPRRPNRAPAKAEKQREATAEEQKKILKMVENGTISPEEANMLLEALEG